MTNKSRIQELEDLIASLALDEEASLKWRAVLDGLRVMDAAEMLQSDEVSELLAELRQTDTDATAVAQHAHMMAQDAHPIKEL